MKKAILFCIIIVLILGNFNFINIAADQEESKTICEENPSYLNRDVRIVKPTIDQNSNKISDNLENSQFVLSDSETMIDVIVALDHAPNFTDISAIELFGGIVYETWDELIFALHAKIPQKNLAKYALNDEVVLIEENAEIQTCLDYSVKQMRVRPTVWDTYGYSGNSSHAIAILDTGIDDSHPDLSGKIVKWKDFTDDDYTSPIDKGEHGTHCAGIAVGPGTKSGTNTKKYTWSSWFDYYHDPLLPTYVAPSKSGTLQVNLEWDDDLSNGMGEGLIWIDKNQDEVVDSGEYITGSTPLTYSVPVNSGRYKVGVQANDSAASLEDFYCQLNVPAQSLGDGHNLLTGVAPNCKLAGLKIFCDDGSGGVDEIIDGLEWLAQNAQTYGIIIASMSIGLEYGEINNNLDTAVNNLVSKGVICVVAAGNDQGYYYVASPGSAAKTITVGAVNDNDALTDYSSLGNLSGSPLKPDVLAPGGSRNTGDKIISVDSNDADETYELDPDCYSDDHRAMDGTSMACPHVSGLVALVADAMGTWQYTEEQALKVKQIILMTSYEIGFAENDDFEPPFNYGGKDNKEGYGRVCADAAIEATSMTINSDTIYTFSFGNNIWDKKVWARQVSLEGNFMYNFTMNVPATGDYDLYLYDEEPDGNGEPILLSCSCNAGDNDEVIGFSPQGSGTYYIIAKWYSGSGQATVTCQELNDPPVANFSWSTDDLEVNFTDESIDTDGYIDSWSWDFGDGNTSTSQNPTHTYLTAGDYQVTLNVTDDDVATDDITKSVTVTMATIIEIYVDDDFTSSTPGWQYDHFDNIQDGIDAVGENGNVYVYNGTYYENVFVNKTIDLIGENRDSTIIDGNNFGYIITLASNNRGF